jgi:hypothetical protein
MLRLLILCTAFTLIGSSIATADNITIYDGRGYSGIGVGGEDNETEPGMINDQSWDLEAFTLNGNNLGIVAGFDLKDGNPYSSPTIILGDIFIDINGDAQYASPTNPTIDNFGYEYAVKLNFNTKTYTVYNLNDNSILTSTYYYNSPESDPLALTLNNESIKSSGIFTYTDFGYTTHNSIDGINLSFIDPGTTFTSHVTMSCGNDNLMGRGTTTSVPEPSSMGFLLLGLSLLAVGIKRKYNRK